MAGMGQDFEARKNKDNNKLVKAYHTMFSPNWESALAFVLRFVMPGWLVEKLPLKRNSDMQKARQAIRDVCSDLIRLKSAKLEKGKLLDVDNLSTAIQNGGFSDEALIDQITTFLLAGHETIGVAMTWAIYGLCQHPDVQKKLHSEIRAHLRSPAGGSDVTSLDIDRVPYLIAVCNEVIRYYDVFVWTWREAAVDTSIGGQPIPKGTMLVLPFTVIHRDKNLWGETADDFNVERWMPDNPDAPYVTNGGARNNFAFMSLLHGPRSCIGETFARAEFACLLAAWVGRFEFELNDEREIDYQNLKTAGTSL